MQNNNNNDDLSVLSLFIAMLAALAVPATQYRWFEVPLALGIFTLSSYGVYKFWKEGAKLHSILSLIVAVLFNPFVLVIMGQESWIVGDIATTIAFFVTSVRFQKFPTKEEEVKTIKVDKTNLEI